MYNIGYKFKNKNLYKTYITSPFKRTFSIKSLHILVKVKSMNQIFLHILLKKFINMYNNHSTHQQQNT